MRWRQAMEQALYGPDGFFTRPGPGPAGHFRTSANASTAFAGAVATLVARVDASLGHPDRLDVVDVGAGRGELLTALLAALPQPVTERVHAVAVERAARPDALPSGIEWATTIPTDLTGVLLATEWLDNVPLDVVEVDPAGTVRYVLVDRDGTEHRGPPVDAADAEWLERWWPLSAEGARAEIGRPRDAAWAAAVSAVRRGLALAVDYGHRRDRRPSLGTLVGFRAGREAPPVPDGSCDLTAHVAVDAALAAGGAGVAVRQRAALRALGVDGRRPPLELAHRDPAGYVRALAAASHAAELTDPDGLGGHFWLLHPVSTDLHRSSTGLRMLEKWFPHLPWNSM
jgi:SAM-dependent MidA family methyltransferase